MAETTHDHGSMTTHDHGSMTTPHDHGTGDMSNMMMMYFHFGFENETVLFEGWTLSSLDILIGSCIGVFFMAVFYEGLKYLREYLMWRLGPKDCRCKPDTSESSAENSNIVKSSSRNRSKRNKMFNKSHCIQTLLFMVQVTLSYFLMLIAMVYNAWLMIAIVLGATVGYFLFGWYRSSVVDVTDDCH